MSRVEVPVFTGTTKPMRFFGLDARLFALVIVGSFTIGTMVFVSGFWNTWGFSSWAFISGIVAILGGFWSYGKSKKDHHIITVWVAGFRGWKGGKKVRRFLPALLFGLIAQPALAAVEANFRPPPVLDLDEIVMVGLGLFVAAGAVGVLAKPLLVWGRFHKSGGEYFENHLEFDHILEDGMTVVLHSGRKCRYIRVRGMQYATKEEGLQRQALNARVQFLNSLRDTGIIARFVFRRKAISGEVRRLAEDVYSKYPTETLQAIGDHEARFFGDAWLNEFLLVLEGPGEKAGQRQLDDATSAALANLDKFSPEIVRAGTEGRCPLTEIICEHVNGTKRRLGPSARSLALEVGALAYDFDKATGLITSYDGATPRYERIIVVKEYREKTSGSLFRRIMEIKGNIEVTLIARSIETTRAKATLLNQSKQASMFGFNPILAEDFNQVYAVVEAGRETLFETQTMVLVRSRSMEELEDILARIEKLFSDDNIGFAYDTFAALEEWFERLPGRVVKGKPLPRPLNLISSNVAALASFSKEPEGMEASPFGEGPIRTFNSVRGTIYQFQFHVSERAQSIGHYAVIAPSDSGKTTLMLHLMGGMLKHKNTKGFVFDSNFGARFMIEAFGGSYYDLNRTDEGAVSMNPLQLRDTEANRAHLRRLMRIMSNAEGDEDIAIIERAVRQAMGVEEVRKRTFSGIYQSAFPNGSHVAEGMRKWIEDMDERKGAYAYLFNGARDELAQQMQETFLVGWNADQILKETDVAAAVFEHIGHVIKSECATGGFGFNIFIDEAANLFRNQTFKREAEVMFREYRKLDGIVGVAFQEPGALHETGVTSAVMTNCSTFFLFPNATARPEDYQDFNLNPTQMEYILGGSDLSKGLKRTVLLIKRDKSGGADSEESVILDVDLREIAGPMMKVYRSGSKSIALMEELQATYGRDNLTWVDHLP
ncbi:hypothetical protein [Magnetospira sp. QH-2]|uniref:VirB4 family type IV secretion/conjugal transfer ATPase n=1 Tax=Magnetospira sp. (strain QH-2) TaxID=1288970 RepID=UPI0003E80E12|nr:hypothetical protein [Magnetospira sp. QH-2]CCQ75760.1 Type IV secretion system protein VirB4 [Magnetospira sp. QH-2]